MLASALLILQSALCCGGFLIFSAAYSGLTPGYVIHAPVALIYQVKAFYFNTFAKLKKGEIMSSILTDCSTVSSA